MIGGDLSGGSLIGGAEGYPAHAAYPDTTAVGCAFNTKVYGLVVIPTISVLPTGLPNGDAASASTGWEGNFAGGAFSFGGGALRCPCASRILEHSANFRFAS